MCDISEPDQAALESQETSPVAPAPAPEPGLSTGLIVGIVVGVLSVLVVLVVAFLFVSDTRLLS